MTLIEHNCQCPYCSSQITLLIDPSESQQRYVEDCSRCCQPMLVDLLLALQDGDQEPQLLACQLEQENG